MDKTEFLKLMKFPCEWDTLGMYPDELASIQLKGYLPGHENASEHVRNGAFHWWLKKNPSEQHLKWLMFLACIDPDKHMGEDIRRYIQKAKHYAKAVEEKWHSYAIIQRFSRRRRWRTSSAELDVSGDKTK